SEARRRISVRRADSKYCQRIRSRNHMTGSLSVQVLHGNTQSITIANSWNEELMLDVANAISVRPVPGFMSS
ncbi:MAG: hypothetical protein LC630_07065, partial [Bacteroidales bacterium]|nr:hypothetical protein [Bacteroidales bacterium]